MSNKNTEIDCLHDWCKLLVRDDGSYFCPDCKRDYEKKDLFFTCDICSKEIKIEDKLEMNIQGADFEICYECEDEGSIFVKRYNYGYLKLFVMDDKVYLDHGIDSTWKQIKNKKELDILMNANYMRVVDILERKI